MLALYRSGRQAEALDAYRRARTYLDEGVGLEPSQELKRLEQAILRQDVPAVEPQEERHNLPSPLTSFVGRGGELADLGHLVTEHRLVTLTGVGGSGKTRLALEAARRALPDFADGISFVDLSAVGDPRLVARRLAGTLEVREQPGTAVEDLLVDRLRETELLLLLDNCEHMREACAELAQRLLAACPGLRILATSREVLGAPGEVDYAVPPLAVPELGAGPDELRRSEAVRLFVARAQEARPHLSEDEQMLASAARIARDLDGLPLALELAAARAKALSLQEIQARLADRFRFLVSRRRVTAARHRTLREAMDWSYELLDAEEQMLLTRVSVFAGGFTLVAAAAVCLGSDEERALELVQRLLDASLVVAEERNETMRYRLLETVRQYAAEQLEVRGDGAETRRAYVRFYCDFARSAELRGGPEQSLWLERLDAELDNLRNAIETAAASGDSESELGLVGALGRYWWIRGYLTESRARIDEALLRADGVDPAVLAEPLHRGAGLAWAEGDFERAHALGQEAVAAARAAGDALAELSATRCSEPPQTIKATTSRRGITTRRACRWPRSTDSRMP